jgi:Ca2+-binding EF-hand superfamily protein
MPDQGVSDTSTSDDLRRRYNCYWEDCEQSDKSLRNCFLIFDKDGDGTIGQDELASVLNNLGENSSEEEVAQMLVAADDDTSGALSFGEFYKVMTGSKMLKPSEVSDVAMRELTRRDDARKIFDAVDEDGSGTLSTDEVGRLAGSLAAYMPRRHMLHALEEMGEMAEISERDGGTRGVTFQMFKTWWDDRQRHWTDLLVIPEALVFSVRRVAESGGRMPPTGTNPTPHVRWGRLAALLQVVSALTQDTWGDPREIYTTTADDEHEKHRAEAVKVKPSSGLLNRLKPSERLSVAEEIEREAQAMACFLRPNSRMRQAWDLVQVPMLLYIFVTVPFRTSFNVDLTPEEPIFWYEAIVDLYFIVDIAMNMRTAYYDKSGLLSISPGTIFCNYLKTWFVILLSTIMKPSKVAY